MGFYKLKDCKGLLNREQLFIINKHSGRKGYGHEVRAIVREWNGGRHGSPGEFVAIVRPRLGKNGTPLKKEPIIVKKLDEIKKGYNYGSFKIYTIREFI